MHIDEARYFMGTCKATLITSSELASEHAQEIASSLSLSCVPFTPSYRPSPPNIQFELTPKSEFLYSPDRGIYLIYTSGTTGPSKGVLMSCGSALIGTQRYQKTASFSYTDKWLHRMPTHWKGGLDFVLVAAYTGMRIEFANSVLGPDWFWQRMRNGGDITCFSLPPALIPSFRERFDAIEDPGERETALKAVNNARLVITGGIRISESVKEVWRELMPRRELTNLYGMTEVAGPVAMTDWRATKPGVSAIELYNMIDIYTDRMDLHRMTAARITQT